MHTTMCMVFLPMVSINRPPSAHPKGVGRVAIDAETFCLYTKTFSTGSVIVTNPRRHFVVYGHLSFFFELWK